jgi:hypothetical protein
MSTGQWPAKTRQQLDAALILQRIWMARITFFVVLLAFLGLLVYALFALAHG